MILEEKEMHRCTHSISNAVREERKISDRIYTWRRVHKDTHLILQHISLYDGDLLNYFDLKEQFMGKQEWEKIQLTLKKLKASESGEVWWGGGGGDILLETQGGGTGWGTIGGVPGER